MKRAWPVLAVALVCAPAAYWWLEQLRFAALGSAEFCAAPCAALVLLGLRRASPGAQRASLLPAAIGVLAYALAWSAGAPLLATAAAALALASALSACWLGASLRIELAALALLSLPVVPLFQFQLGHLLRLLTAGLSSALLRLGGWDAHSQGTGLFVCGATVWVDEPCSGVRGLWVGLFTAACAAWSAQLSLARASLLLTLAPLLLLGANALRAAALGLAAVLPMPLNAQQHEAVGLATDGCALIAVALLARRWRRSA